MISQDVQAVYHEPVAAIPAVEATWDGTNTGDPHAPEGPQPKRHPALLTGVAVPWCLWAERAFPHTQHTAFPIGAFFLVNSHQRHLVLLGASHVGDAKPPRCHAGSRKVVEMEATVRQLGSRTSSIPFVWLWRART